MAEVKLYKLSVSGQELDAKLAQIEQNLESINANSAADEEFKSLVAATYATKEELSKLLENDTEKIDSIVEIINLLDTKVNASDVASLLSSKADKTELENYQPKGEYLTEHQDLSNYATTEYVAEKINELLNGADADHDTLKEIVDLLDKKQDAAEFIAALQSKADKSELDKYALKNELPEVPSIDGLISEEDADAKYQPKGEYLTEHQSLDKYALKSELPDVPTKISAFENDANYLTEHQSLDDYALKSELPEVPSIEGLATEDYVNNKISEVIDGAPEALNTLNEIATELAKKQGTAELIDILGMKANASDLDNYALKSELPEVPSIDGLISEEDADAKYQQKGEYLTEHQDLSAYALKSELPSVPTKVSEFENDANYLTAHQSLEEYATKRFLT